MASCRLEKDVVSNTHTHTAHKKRNTKKNSKRKSEESREWCQSGREKEEEEVEEKERHTTLTTGCSYDTEESKKKKRKRQDKNNNHHNNKRTERILSSGQAIQRDRVIVVHRSIKERWFIGQKWSPLRLNNKSEKRCWLVVNMFLSLCVCLPVCRVYKKLIKELGGILEKGEIFFFSVDGGAVVAAFVWRWCEKPVGSLISSGINNRLHKEIEPAHYLLDCQVVLPSPESLKQTTIIDSLK